VTDMMQICKNNSISGCKLASCKMVWTPHSNLKKTFDMESGAVTYHDTKMCRYGRCEKDRARVRDLEKTKSADTDVDYYQEMKDNERKIIERKKRMRRTAQNDDDGMYDPMLEDMKSMKMKSGRQGDTESGLDAGLDMLDGISFAAAAVSGPHDGAENEEEQSSKIDRRPVWLREEEQRQSEPTADVRFLRERGYSSSEATAACCTVTSRSGALRKLYNATGNDTPQSSEASVEAPEEVVQARMEEKEVLLAMFGFADDDDEAAAVFSDADDENALDVILPITGYEPPERYGFPPPLMLEVYVDKNIAPLYPNEPPVLAAVGGGLPESLLRDLTQAIRAEARERAAEEPGEPQIFTLIAFAGEAAEGIVQKETEELEAERKEAAEAERAAKEAARKEAGGGRSDTTGGAAFANEAERRAYAREVASRAAGGAVSNDDDKEKKKKTAKPKFNAKTGVSDRSLIDDLFS